MMCLACEEKTQVIDSRHTGLTTVRRRRKCKSCSHTFTTQETPYNEDIYFTTRSGRRLEFSPAELLSSLEAVCYGRPVNAELVCKDVVRDIRVNKHVPLEHELLTSMVMKRLLDQDKLAAHRYEALFILEGMKE